MEPIPGEKNKREITFKFWDTKRDKKFLKSLAVLAVVLASLVTIKDEFLWQLGYYDDLAVAEESLFGTENSADQDAEESNCNVMGIELHGELTTYISPVDRDADGNPLEDRSASEDIVYWIRQAEEDDKAKAILLEIDSYGGGPTAAEEISNALKRAEKPTVALIREGGTSAAYLAATGADTIFASSYSDVGGIGVTMSYLDKAEQNRKEGLNYNQISFGNFKDAGDPDKPLTAEERQLLMRDGGIIYDNFIAAVAENRELAEEKVRALADGSSMLGEMALANGLIDRIGGIAEVEEYLKTIIKDDVSICWP